MKHLQVVLDTPFPDDNQGKTKAEAIGLWIVTALNGRLGIETKFRLVTVEPSEQATSS